MQVVHRPGAVQTEIRVGHPALSRRNPDFYAVSVMSAILGGLFNSRLNMNLREEKGYTYGASAGFDMRRARGPFAARAAVNTEVTVPALREMLGELDRIREAPVTDDELRAARDFLVGVFPLRFETPGPVAGSLAGLFVHDLPEDELDALPRLDRGGHGRRTSSASPASTSARRRRRSCSSATTGSSASALEAEGLGPITVIEDAQG